MDTPTYMITAEVAKELSSLRKASIADALQFLGNATASIIPMGDLLRAQNAVARAIAATAAIDPEEASFAIRHAR